MSRPCVTRNTLVQFITRLDAAFGRPGRLFLIGESTFLYERWRAWTRQIEFTADVSMDDRREFSQVVAALRADLGVPIFDESPADVIPLPDGFEDRARPVRDQSANGSSTRPITYLALHHFDPYSVCFRYIARGDEPDYHLVLTYLEHGWVTLEEMNERLEALLTRFTCEVIQQDPAEFRRKYKGLMQMARAVRPGTTHRPTAV
jgi:hypothetical protein